MNITDTVVINYFRNGFDKTKIRRIRRYSKKGWKRSHWFNNSVPDDGVLSIDLNNVMDTLAISCVNTSDAQYFNNKYGLSSNEFDFSNKRICFLVIGRNRWRRCTRLFNTDSLFPICGIVKGKDDSYLLLNADPNAINCGVDAVVVYTNAPLSDILDDIIIENTNCHPRLFNNGD